MQQRLNCWEAYEKGEPCVNKGDILIANESYFGLYEDREYKVLDTHGRYVEVEIFPGKPEWYSIEYFDFPLESL